MVAKGEEPSFNTIASYNTTNHLQWGDKRSYHKRAYFIAIHVFNSVQNTLLHNFLHTWTQLVGEWYGYVEGFVKKAENTFTLNMLLHS